MIAPRPDPVRLSNMPATRYRRGTAEADLEGQQNFHWRAIKSKAIKMISCKNFATL